MRQTITDLCAILEEQRDVLVNMLKLAKEERQIIVDNKSDELEGVIRLEFKELSKLGSIEKRRLALMSTIAEQLDIDESGITVTAIAEAATPEECEAIKALQKELMPLIEEHTKVNQENRSLIEAHVEYSQMMLEMMVGNEDPLNNMYGGDGRSAEKKKSTGLFDGHA